MHHFFHILYTVTTDENQRFLESKDNKIFNTSLYIHKTYIYQLEDLKQTNLICFMCQSYF